MNTTQNIYDKIAEAGVLFNVHTEPLQTLQGKPVRDRVAIVNTETGNPLSIVSNRYKVVSNNDIVVATLNAIEAAKLDTTDAEVMVQTSAHGARSMIRIVMPAYSVLAGQNQTNLEIVTLNAYDGTWKYMTKAGGMRVACLNGQVMGKIIGSYSQYHNASLNVERGAENLVRMIGEFNTSGEWFTKMMNRATTEAEVDKLVVKFLAIAAVHIDDSRAATRIRESYKKYATEMGANAYAVYNAFTDFITHRSRHKTAVASSRLYDENRFSSEILSQKMFN